MHFDLCPASAVVSAPSSPDGSRLMVLQIVLDKNDPSIRELLDCTITERLPIEARAARMRSVDLER
ncbi:hypothetical protein M3484_02190 [Pseudomonas sp. GX19020]|uniref:hypothetical protein n=1 Tax=Pseudomonas sp. GX19020 TaxID=2942277 RepID=UPI0020185553|nr:hypothetical protein [Pseudomonas sp. GX19020]MCL4065384.1 hypothetical protein [Pseudomonas sp. GX19020]